jgi:hypothetical protein
MTYTAPKFWPFPGWINIDDSLVVSLYNESLSNLGVRFIAESAWACDQKSFDGLDDLVVCHKQSNMTTGFMRGEDYAALLFVYDGRIRLQLGATSQAVSERVAAAYREHFPSSQPSEDEIVPVTFWVWSAHDGAMARSRRIQVARWESIESNYSPSVQERLGMMMNGFRPSHGGQLVLWQGPAGTGKTHALRALAWEWRDWADLHYVVDPDEMFGSHANYLLSVLLNNDNDDNERWQVLVLEDTGELLAADAKQRTGQALSRLLNVVDGLIGQGLRTLVLVTTNEELRELHPAVVRPGRCAMQIAFDALPLNAARDWLKERGIDEMTVHAASTLAELYAVAEDYAARPKARPVGFANIN